MRERAASPISKRNLARESEFLTHTLLASEGEFRILVRRSRGLHVEWMDKVKGANLRRTEVGSKHECWRPSLLGSGINESSRAPRGPMAFEKLPLAER